MKLNSRGELSSAQDCALCNAEGAVGSMSLKLPEISSNDVAASMGSSALTNPNLQRPGSRITLNEADLYGGYPMKFLVMVVSYNWFLISRE